MIARPRAFIVVTGSELVRGERTDLNGRSSPVSCCGCGVEPARISIVGDRRRSSRRRSPKARAPTSASSPAGSARHTTTARSTRRSSCRRAIFGSTTSCTSRSGRISAHSPNGSAAPVDFEAGVRKQATIPRVRFWGWPAPRPASCSTSATTDGRRPAGPAAQAAALVAGAAGERTAASAPRECDSLRSCVGSASSARASPKVAKALAVRRRGDGVEATSVRATSRSRWTWWGAGAEVVRTNSRNAHRALDRHLFSRDERRSRSSARPLPRARAGPSRPRSRAPGAGSRRGSRIPGSATSSSAAMVAYGTVKRRELDVPQTARATGRCRRGGGGDGRGGAGELGEDERVVRRPESPDPATAARRSRSGSSSSMRRAPARARARTSSSPVTATSIRARARRSRRSTSLRRLRNGVATKLRELPASVDGRERARLFCALRLPEESLDTLSDWQADRIDGAGSTRRRTCTSRSPSSAPARWRSSSRSPGAARGRRGRAADAAPAGALPRDPERRDARAERLEEGRSALADDLQGRLERLGVYERERRLWLPHVTVVRFRERRGSGRRCLRSGRSVRPMPLPTIPCCGPVGAQYVVLESFALGG